MIMMEQRLIDANRLKHVLDINFGGFGGAAVLAQLIDVQPTAYDLDKVVEQLEEEKKQIEKSLFHIKYRDGFDGGISRAIEIVKGGVNNEE